jgi:fluoride ion exporter CrcB/FEX
VPRRRSAATEARTTLSTLAHSAHAAKAAGSLGRRFDRHMSAPEPEPAPGEAPPSSAQPGYGQAEAVKEATPPEAAAPPAAPSAPPGGGGRGCAALLPPKFDGASAISICAFGYLGVFLRLALKAFSSWWSVEQPGTCQLLGQIGHGFFLPNIVGCFLMGFAKRAAEFHWGRHGLAYTGFTTGLCGCLTTFATWNQAASMQIVRGNVSDGLLVCATRLLLVCRASRCPLRGINDPRCVALA